MASMPRTITVEIVVDVRHVDWSARRLRSAIDRLDFTMAKNVVVAYRPWLPLGERLTRTAS